MSTKLITKLKKSVYCQNRVSIYNDAGPTISYILLFPMSSSTIVTGIWDLGRDSLDAGWSRGFDHYISKFRDLLQNLDDIPLIVFIDPKHESIVWEYRKKDNTVVYHHKKEDFSGSFFPFFNEVQTIRTNEKWLNQVGWLKDSTQARMKYYNPMVMSKMFLLHNAKIFNPFNTEYMFWLDGGITNTVHPGYFSKDKVIQKIEKIVEKFIFICFPYETTTEIHGFDIHEMKRYCNDNNVNRVARGGFFGGHIDYISEANNDYYSLLNESLNQGLMGTEESIFTIMTYQNPEIYRYETINNDGLISTLFENIKNDIVLNQNSRYYQVRKPYANNDVLLYINTFNSPEQLEMVLDSFKLYDSNFINKTKKILINNTTKESLIPKYDKICEEYQFIEHIKQGNKGICRSRQIAAEHFANSGSKYMMFFEDDMLLDLSNTVCQVGLSKFTNNLFDNLIKIMNKEQYDFLKFSFTEFFGHNGEQWAWHNVPSEKRIKYFGDSNKKPQTKISCIKTHNGVPYAEGEIYYSNWPHIIDQEGNQKLFLDTKWDHPFEQTWMSHVYELTLSNTVKPAILLTSPITHNRVHFYEREERKEN